MTRAAVDTLAVAGAWFLAACAFGAAWALWRGHQKRRAGGRPAPGDGQPPVPGDVSPGEAAHPPSRPSPAPGLTYEDVLHLVLWADELRNRL